MAELAVGPTEDIFATSLPVWKRTMDIVASFLGLLVISPVLGLVAVYIKVVSPGPVFFRQERYGLAGNTFTMWKFRTMRHGSSTTDHERHMANLISGSSDDEIGNKKLAMPKLDDNPSLIRGAAVLRKSCIDELPQLWNVLRGEMTLVGPRPPIPYEVDEYRPWHWDRFDIVPGMTGLWQVSGKNELSFDEMVRLDIQYGREMSLVGDLVILLKTPGVVSNEIARSIANRRSARRGGETMN